MIELTTENFEEEVIRSDATVYVVFTSARCGYCHSMEELLRSVEHVLTDVKFCVVDADKCPELAVKYAVRGVPTSLVFRGSEIKNRKTGQIGKAQVYELLSRSPKEKTAVK